MVLGPRPPAFPYLPVSGQLGAEPIAAGAAATAVAAECVFVTVVRSAADASAREAAVSVH